MNEAGKDWKLKLRYGKLKTEFQHLQPLPVVLWVI